jgi:P4 family phage/plasmid primase-like protien
MVIGTPTGMIRLGQPHTWQEPPDRKAYITKSTSVDMPYWKIEGAGLGEGRDGWNPVSKKWGADGPPLPLFSKFFDEVTRGYNATQNYLQGFFGYCLTGLERYQLITFLWGSGGNGKTVLMETIAAIMGDYAGVFPARMLMAGFRENPDYHYADLKGKRLLVASELGKGRRWETPLLLHLTGGDTRKARNPRGRPFSYTPTDKLVIIGNNLPGLGERTAALERRLRLLRVGAPAVKVNPRLKEQLKKEYSEILEWLVMGCASWMDGEPAAPPLMHAATDEYFEEEDTFRIWIEERCIFDKKAQQPRKHLYDGYLDWTEASGNRTPLTPADFYRAVRDLPGVRAFTLHGARMVHGLRVMTNRELGRRLLRIRLTEQYEARRAVTLKVRRLRRAVGAHGRPLPRLAASLRPGGRLWQDMRAAALTYQAAIKDAERPRPEAPFLEWGDQTFQETPRRRFL